MMSLALSALFVDVLCTCTSKNTRRFLYLPRRSVRSCRAMIATYRTSSLQSVASTPRVEELVEASRLVKYVRQTEEYGLTFRPGLVWPKSATDVEMCVVAVSDASHTAKCKCLDDFDEILGHFDALLGKGVSKSVCFYCNSQSQWRRGNITRLSFLVQTFLVNIWNDPPRRWFCIFLSFFFFFLLF